MPHFGSRALVAMHVLYSSTRRGPTRADQRHLLDRKFDFGCFFAGPPDTSRVDCCSKKRCEYAPAPRLLFRSGQEKLCRLIRFSMNNFSACSTFRPAISAWTTPRCGCRPYVSAVSTSVGAPREKTPAQIERQPEITIENQRTLENTSRLTQKTNANVQLPVRYTTN